MENALMVSMQKCSIFTIVKNKLPNTSKSITKYISITPPLQDTDKNAFIKESVKP